MESVLGADSTIQSLCEDIVNHYEKYRANLLTGKAMIVAYSRPIAMKIYRKLLDNRCIIASISYNFNSFKDKYNGSGSAEDEINRF